MDEVKKKPYEDLVIPFHPRQAAKIMDLMVRSPKISDALEMLAIGSVEKPPENACEMTYFWIATLRSLLIGLEAFALLQDTEEPNVEVADLFKDAPPDIQAKLGHLRSLFAKLGVGQNGGNP